MPSTIIEPPAEGEIAALEYGGYLNFGINASAGFEIKGTKSFNIRELKLSKHYDRAIVGKLDLSARVGGRFSVQVRCGENPDWIRVIVRLHATAAEARASSLKLIFKRDGKKRMLVFTLPRN